ncbi:MAG: AI-2E family transporter, partial [Gammaproteobacteria bacterium]|nr:AI-2E family transporter [Gammaproteobacteria bacterium]
MTESNKWMYIFLTLLVGFLIYSLSPILTPFLVAAVFSYIGDPLVDRLETRMPRTAAVAVVFSVLSLVVLLVLLIFVPLIEKQISIFVHKLPLYLDQIQHKFLPMLNQKLGLPEQSISFDVLKKSIQDYWSSAGGLAKGMIASVSRSGLVLAELMANLLLIPVVTFYLLRDWDHLVARINELIPRRSQPIVAKLARESDSVLGAFLRGQLLVMLGLTFIYSIGLTILGLDLGILIGVLSGVISFVPYLGFI